MDKVQEIAILQKLIVSLISVIRKKEKENAALTAQINALAAAYGNASFGKRATIIQDLYNEFRELKRVS